ncbi:MAG TPA: hypothetical protein VE891_03810 [Allosphingosinicella sp.]|nr:hypothetical protein [Allosphingosinicella sp.]
MRASAALAALTAFSGAAVTIPAQASTPAPIWQNVVRVNVLCLVQTESGVDTGALHNRICNSVRDRAAAGSPAPVGIVAMGDPAVLSPGSLTLLVQASAQRGLLAFSIRPYRNSGEAMLFTAAPRAVPLAGAQAKEFEAALGAALSETLPWLSRPAGARPLR